jgi:hypothetical protein
VEAIETIRATIAATAGGEDPFILDESTVKIAFGITADGDISIGVNKSLSTELTQTLILNLVPALPGRRNYVNGDSGPIAEPCGFAGETRP